MPYFRCPTCGVTAHSTAAYSSTRLCPNCSAPLADDARVELVPMGKRGTDVRVPPPARPASSVCP